MCAGHQDRLSAADLRPYWCVDHVWTGRDIVRRDPSCRVSRHVWWHVHVLTLDTVSMGRLPRIVTIGGLELDSFFSSKVLNWLAGQGHAWLVGGAGKGKPYIASTCGQPKWPAFFTPASWSTCCQGPPYFTVVYYVVDRALYDGPARA